MTKRRASLDSVEEAVGHSFARRELLERAMTHSSVSSDNVKDLERLEFLGDRVLGLLTAENLWRRYPDMSEGELAPRLNQLVRKETCADAARHFNLGPALKMSAGEENNGGRDRDAILGDAMEALLGALYIDGGLEAAERVYDMYWGKHFDAIADQHLDAKTAFQEWSQAHGHGTPSYADIKRRGPDHAPCFTVEVRAGKLKPEQAEGSSKRDAQTAAARKMLVREGVWSDD
ncbi:ribonuclease III [Parvularcula lutaonensis]|uniref:Ribonuclease 3 n=1 Tax=Parvularcula lutaonensis TaxID=491923 RepID=A0ABV7MDJ2_9PROT